MFEGEELVRFDQAAERSLDELFAVLEVVEDLGSEDEEPAIDPEVSVLWWRADL